MPATIADGTLAVPDDATLAPVGPEPTTEAVEAMRALQKQGDAEWPAGDPTGPRADAVAPVGLISVPAAEGSLDAIRQRVMAWAASKVGAKESPPYSNHIFVWDDVYPQWHGSPWCLAFVDDGWARQGVDFRKVLDLPFYCPSLEQWAKSIGAWRPYGSGWDPKPGDPVLFGRKVASHVGLSAPAPGNYAGYRTIEGNTSASNAGSQTNGDGVYVRFRDGGFIRGWVDMDVAFDHMVKAGKVARAATAPTVTAADAAPKRAATPTPTPTQEDTMSFTLAQVEEAAFRGADRAIKANAPGFRTWPWEAKWGGVPAMTVLSANMRRAVAAAQQVVAPQITKEDVQ